MHEIEPKTDGQQRDSGMRLDFTLSIGYTRRRPGEGVEDRWEAHVGTVGLLITGGLIAILVILIVLPRVLDALGKS